MVTIKVRENGSLLVEGEDVKLVDWTGAEYVVPKNPLSLCRCGQTAHKPICYGSQKACGFVGNEAAPGPRANPPAPPEI